MLFVMTSLFVQLKTKLELRVKKNRSLEGSHDRFVQNKKLRINAVKLTKSNKKDWRKICKFMYFARNNKICARQYFEYFNP